MEELDDWVRDYLRLGRALAAADINQTAWQDGMDRLFAMYEPVDVLERIDFDSVSRKLTGTEAKGRRNLFQPVLIDGAAPEPASDPEPARVVITQIAYIPKGCS
ncbi:MAG: hypothetical protein ACRD1T_05640, partial [Acidimicrobiia bacterium]